MIRIPNPIEREDERLEDRGSISMQRLFIAERMSYDTTGSTMERDKAGYMYNPSTLLKQLPSLLFLLLSFIVECTPQFAQL